MSSYSRSSQVLLHILAWCCVVHSLYAAVLPAIPATRPNATSVSGVASKAAAVTGNATTQSPTAVPPKPAAKAEAAAKTPSSPKPSWKASYPFPQCLGTTQSYDVSFVGPVKYQQVGPVKYAYHRFGPLSEKPQQVDIVDPIRMERAGKKAVNASNPNSPLVFISGLGMSMYMWPVPVLQRLAEDREVIIFDNMRTGLTTDTSNSTLSIQLMANSTVAFITQLGLEQPDVYGWSVGGCVAYAILAYHSSKVDNVMIAGGTPGGPNSYLPPQSVIDNILNIGTDYNALLPYLFPQGAKDEGVCAFFAAYNSFYNSQYTKLERPIAVKSLQEQGQAIVRFAQKSDVINKLSSATNRVLIMHGVQDRLIPISNAPLADDLLLGSWMLQMPGEGHAVPFSHVQATIYMTQEFFGFANVLTSAEHKQWADYGVKVSAKQQAGR